MLPPESVADDDHGSNAPLKIRVPNVPAQLRRHAEQRKKVCGYLGAFDMLGQIAAAQIRVPAADSRELAELRALLTPVAEVCRRRTEVCVVLLGRRFPDRDHAIEIRKWKWPEEHRIDRTESGCIGADTQRESNHSNGGEAGALPQRAKSVTNILDQSSHCLFLIRIATQPWDRLSWHGALECNKQPTPPG